MIQTPPDAIEAARRLRERAPVRAHRIGRPDDELPPQKETKTMPKKAKAPTAAQQATPPEAKPRRPYTRHKARAGVPSAARFGVFDDGTIQINLPTCSGIIGTDDAKDFLTFAKRIGMEESGG